MDIRTYWNTIATQKWNTPKRPERKRPEALDPEQSLKDIVSGKWVPRSTAMRISWKIAALCTPELIAGLETTYDLLKWMGHLSAPEVGRELMRRVLARAESMPRNVVEDFVAAPILLPVLVLAGAWNGRFVPCSSPEAKRQRPKKLTGQFCRPVAPSASADAIVNRASAVLDGFGVSNFEHYLSSDMRNDGHSVERVRNRSSPEVVKIVKSDSADQLRVLADIRAEPMPVALMLYDGGPKCLELLLRPETYEGNALGMESVATFAAMCLPGDAAMTLLPAFEAERPGFLRGVKDDAGHNLLWYLGFRKTLSISRERDRDGKELRRIRDYLLKKAKCDPTERDAFGFSWMDVREKLDLWGIGTCL